MSKIDNEQNAKKGLNLLFGGVKVPTTKKEKKVPEDTPLTKEQIIESINDPETLEILTKTLQKRQYSKVGRPKKDKSNLTKEERYIRRTFLVNESQIEKIEYISKKETLFIKEILEEGLRMFIEEYESKNGEIKL